MLLETANGSRSQAQTLSSAELFEKIHKVMKVYSDYVPPLSDAEKRGAIDHARRYGAQAVCDHLDRYLVEKPGKPFRFFLEDCSGAMKAADEVAKAADAAHIECMKCGKLTPAYIREG